MMRDWSIHPVTFLPPKSSHHSFTSLLDLVILQMFRVYVLLLIRPHSKFYIPVLSFSRPWFLRDVLIGWSVCVRSPIPFQETRARCPGEFLLILSWSCVGYGMSRNEFSLMIFKRKFLLRSWLNPRINGDQLVQSLDQFKDQCFNWGGNLFPG